jgi:rhamnosyltransferase
MSKEIRATVLILTYNAAEYIEEVLNACFAQEAPFGYEVLVIDSGSSDSTLEILKDFPVRLHQIPNSEFGHGKTRNLGAKLAKGEFVLNISHDAVPATKHWLEEMLRPFSYSDKIAAVLGKQVPRPDCCPVVKRDVIALFRSFGPDHLVPLSAENPHVTLQAAKDMITFFSDVNSAVRRDILEKIPYPDVDYAEDQALGRQLIKAGYLKAYAPLGAVIHSHNYPLGAYSRRMREEFAGLRKATGQGMTVSGSGAVARALKGSLADWRFILKDHDYSPSAKLKWTLLTPAYNWARWRTIWASGRERG